MNIYAFAYVVLPVFAIFDLIFFYYYFFIFQFYFILFTLTFCFFCFFSLCYFTYNVQFIGNSIRDSLPQVSSSKSLDVYVVICLIYVFIALIEYAAVGITSVQCKNDKKQEVSSLCFTDLHDWVLPFQSDLILSYRRQYFDSQITLNLSACYSLNIFSFFLTENHIFICELL